MCGSTKRYDVNVNETKWNENNTHSTRMYASSVFEYSEKVWYIKAIERSKQVTSVEARTYPPGMNLWSLIHTHTSRSIRNVSWRRAGSVRPKKTFSTWMYHYSIESEGKKSRVRERERDETGEHGLNVFKPPKTFMFSTILSSYGDKKHKPDCVSRSWSERMKQKKNTTQKRKRRIVCSYNMSIMDGNMRPSVYTCFDRHHTGELYWDLL